MFFVYIIKNKRYNWYYVGSTKNIAKRLKEHNHGEVRSTKFRLPYQLIYSEQFDNVSDARAREKQIKTDRQLKTLIINKYGPIV